VGLRLAALFAPRARLPSRSRPPSRPRAQLATRLAEAYPGGDEMAERHRVALDLADLLLAHVVRDDRGDGDEDADAGGDERFGDARHDVPHRPGARRGLPELVERLDDADDGAEQPTNGALFPTVPRNVVPFSSVFFARESSASSASLNAVAPPSRNVNARATTIPSTVPLSAQEPFGTVLVPARSAS
jgi:hypothetical protein